MELVSSYKHNERISFKDFLKDILEKLKLVKTIKKFELELFRIIYLVLA